MSEFKYTEGEVMNFYKIEGTAGDLIEGEAYYLVPLDCHEKKFIAKALRYYKSKKGVSTTTCNKLMRTMGY